MDVGIQNKNESIEKTSALKHNKKRKKKKNKLHKDVNVINKEEIINPKFQYLIDFEQNPKNWKFNKNKQTWIMKNLHSIPREYDSALKAFLKNIKGASKIRLIDNLRYEIDQWKNEMSNTNDDNLNSNLKSDSDISRIKSLLELLTNEKLDIRKSIDNNNNLKTKEMENLNLQQDHLDVKFDSKESDDDIDSENLSDDCFRSNENFNIKVEQIDISC